MYITQPKMHSRDRLHMVPLSRHLPRPWGLSLGKYHTRNGQGSVIVQAIWAARIGSFDLMILTETKITNKAYCRNRMGYDVVCSKDITTVDGDAQGRVVMIVREQLQGCIIELMQFHGPNMLIFKVVTKKRTLLVQSLPPPPNRY